MRHPHRLLAAAALLALAGMSGTAALAKKKPPAPVVLTPVQATPELLAMIDAAIRDGRLPAAREAIARAWSSGSPEVQLRAAELALASDSLPEAVDAFTQLLADPAMAARAGQGLGLTQLRQGKTAEAVATLDKALAADPTLVRGWNARAVAADRLKDWAGADAAYAKAIALAPDDADVLTNRGYSLLLRERFTAAEMDLVRAVTIAPQNNVARTNLRIARAMQGRYEEAFQGATKTSLAEDLNTVGYVAMARGDLSVAEAYFNRAMSLNPAFDRVAWANLQYLKSLQGRARAEEK
jgi:Flp pilus assembly protein TadD